MAYMRVGGTDAVDAVLTAIFGLQAALAPGLKAAPPGIASPGTPQCSPDIDMTCHERTLIRSDAAACFGTFSVSFWSFPYVCPEPVLVK